MSEAKQRLQVLITAGAEDPHKARQGLETAMTACAMEVDVVVFLTLRGAFWARPHVHGNCVVPGCDTIPEILGQLIEMGATVLCCTACALQFVGSCEVDQDLIQGVKVGGLTQVVAETMAGTPTLTF
ncbi:MAG: DsrE family protein [Planctomycetota bacterium]|nr:DsrE family protein [Planctomycetota bacterium]